MDGSYTYRREQNKKYRDYEAVREKWVRIFRDINPYSDPTTMLHSVKEAFTLVECVMSNTLYDYRTAYINIGTPVNDRKNTFIFHYPSGDITIDFMDHSAYGMTKSLRAIGYNIPDDIDETRKLRNFVSHNLETTTNDFFRDNMNYSSVIQAMYNLGNTLVALGMLYPEDVQPSFDSLRVKEGDTIGLSHEFTVDRFIAESGTSRLYEGRHTRLNRRVAIKELMPNTYSETLLNNERDLLVSLSNVHIPHVYDVFNQNGTFYIVMDFIDGVGLDAYINKKRCTLQEKLRIIYDVCDVVNYLHATKEMIHADLKPQNIMLDENANVYLIDFGTAMHKHQTSNVRGVSAGYTAPEVIEGKPMDYRIDIYSIGAIMQFMFWEELQNSEEKYSENAERIRQIITHCMEREPYARYNNVVEIQTELNQIMNNGTVSLRRVAKPKRQVNIPRLILYVVCILTILVSLIIKIRELVQSSKPKNTTETLTTADMAEAPDATSPDGENSAVTDARALGAFRVLEQRAWDCLVSGDEDGYVALFRCDEAGEKQLRENFRQYHEDMQDIYDDCDYVLIYNENGLCYGSATRTLVSENAGSTSYVRREFTYPFSYMDGDWMLDVTAQTGVVTEEKARAKVYEALPEAFNDARNNGRNYALLCGNNYIWMDASLVYEGMLEGSAVAAAQLADGSVCITVSIKNGTAKEQTVQACTVKLATAQGNSIVEGYRAEVNVVIKPRTSTLVSFTVPKESVQNIAVLWDAMQAETVIE